MKPCSALFFSLFILIITALPIKVDAIPAFPGAEGFGANSKGGRGGRVLVVTNLNNGGSGSLRACIEASGPRSCVFRTGGIIKLNTQVQVTNPYLTIAGQTAPGDGVTLRIDPASTLGPMKIMTHDVIVRYLRFRPGNGTLENLPGESEVLANIDAITIGNNRQSGQLYNIIIDHCSFSWGVDENVNIWDDAKNITFQWNIISEGLHCVPGNSECHSKGMIIGSEGSQKISIHHNLFAHNVGRNPMIKTAGIVDLVNNIMHTPQNIVGSVDPQYGRFNSNWVGNYVQAKDDSSYGILKLGSSLLSCANKYYLKNNIEINNKASLNNPEANFVNPLRFGRKCIVQNRYDAAPVTTTSPFQAFDDVLENAGARLPTRDAIDKRIINDVRNKIYRIVNDPSEVGGWLLTTSHTTQADDDRDGMVDSWELTHFGNLSRGSSSDSSSDFDGDGYTDLEEYMNGTDPKKPESDG